MDSLIAGLFADESNTCDGNCVKVRWIGQFIGLVVDQHHLALGSKGRPAGMCMLCGI